MSEDAIRQVLKDFGTTEKEAEIYIFLAKHGALKGGEIARKANTHKALVYRILGNLQAKGLVKATLEVPARFIAEPFESVLDLNIKSRQEEATLLENKKTELLSYWKNISQTILEPTMEKFLVIEGNNRIYPKIAQMIKDTKNQFSAITTIPSLLRAEQYGLFDTSFNHPPNSKIQFRFLTELNEQYLNATKNLLKKIPKTKLTIKGRNPDIGLQSSPQMVIRDEEEILFFITPRTSGPERERNEVCLWTNCRALVQAFKAVFEEGWRGSSDVDTKILSLETGNQTNGTCLISNAGSAEKKYKDIVGSVEKEIMILTSAQGLITFSRKTNLTKDWIKKGVSAKIMAPITSDNIKAVESLSKFCETRHVPSSYLRTTIVDGKHFFQFGKLQRYKNPLEGQGKPIAASDFEDTTYSDNPEYIKKMEKLMNDIWKNSVTPTPATLQSILEPSSTVFDSPKPSSGGSVEIPPFGFPTHCSAQAVIHTPIQCNIPDMLIDLHHFGEPTDEKANWMSISLWLKTPKGHTFVPTAVVLSRGRKDKIASQIENINKAMFAGTPAGQNVLRVKEDELRIWRQGNSLFAGWTVPIPLLPPKYVLPPSFLLFEGYGNSTHLKHVFSKLPSGYRLAVENDGSEAFVTFISPSANYTGPGTDGRLCTNGLVSIIKPE
jgi:hypothetical protein